AFLDAVLHLAAGTVDVLVQVPRRSLAAFQRGGNKARIGLALRPLRLADHTASTAPALAGAPIEIFEAARRPTAPFRRSLCHSKLADQTDVAGEPKNIVDMLVFAPRHQLFTGKAAVRSQQDAHKRPAPAYL